MKVNQLRLNKDHEWEYIGAKVDLKEPLVFVFGDRMLLEKETIYGEMRDLFPDGHIVFGSTSGNIISNEVNSSISITAIEFEKSNFVIHKCNVLNSNLDSFKTGSDLIKQFDTENLKLVFILSEGSFINGSELTNGLNSASKSTVLITGGLCGDNDRFEKTIASYNENPKSGEIIAIGFYGDTIDVSFSVHGGWIPFGPERIVTKSESNILYELDGVPALDLYKKYLGNQSNELPGSALLYPLNVRLETSDKSFTRTILNINEQNNTMILAGDIPEGAIVQLMMTNVDKIVNASELAAKKALRNKSGGTELALLVSCIGRKLVLDHRVEEEVEEIIEVIGPDVAYCGFYSYGEIAPFDEEITCQLHNQTMTITLISE
jgi:hypothetical protein